MKRKLFIFLLIIITATSYAQFDLGIKAGYNSTLSLQNLNTITNGEYTFNNMKSEMRNSFQCGIYTRFNFNRFYLQPELLYSVQKNGFNIEDVVVELDRTMDVDTYVKVSTVDIPIFLGYYIIKQKLFKLRAFVGPKIALNSGSQLEYNNITSGEFSFSELSEDFKNSQVDLEAGVGIDLLRFNIDTKLNLVRDIGGKIQNQENLTEATMPTSTFVISLGFRLF